MLDALLHRLDQLDEPLGTATSESLQKVAEHLNSRRKALQSAPNSDFALVLYDGEQQHRKFPRQTEGDIQMSKTALETRSDRLPDEVVETARYFLDEASREKTAAALYDDRPAPKPTNTVYIGRIDQEAYQEKLARQEKTAHDATAPTLTTGDVELPLQTEGQVKQAAKLFERGFGLSPENRRKAAETLLERSEELGMDLEKTAVTRYDRDSLPPRFDRHVDNRKRRADEVWGAYYDDLKKKARAMPPAKTAETLRALDQAAGLAPMKGEKMARRVRPSAYEVVFPEESIEKSASDDTLDKVADVFGETFRDEFARNEDEAIQKLSGSERALLRSLLND